MRWPVVCGLIGLLVLLSVSLFVLFGVARPEQARGLPTVVSSGDEVIRVQLPWSGEELSLPRGAQRIVPGSSALVDFLDVLVPPARCAAVPDQAFAHGRLAREVERYTAIPRYKRFAAEEILSFQPDLVLASPFNLSGAVDRLREAGVPVLPLPAIATMDDVYQTFHLLGQVLDREERSEELVLQLKGRVKVLKDAQKGQRSYRLLSWTHYGSGGWSAGRGTSADEVFRLAGARNAAALAGLEGHQQVGLERLLTIDPEVLVVGGEAARDEFLRLTTQLGDKTLPLRQRILVMEPELFSANSQVILQAAERLAELLASRDWMGEAPDGR